MGKEKEVKNNSSMKIIKKIIITLLIILFLIITITIFFVYNKLSKVEHIKLSNEELNISENVSNNYRNIALFGVDSRNMNSDIGSRSDGIIILSINDTTKEMKLFSVYRDTYVEVDGHDLTKITHAYAYGRTKPCYKNIEYKFRFEYN